MYTVEYYDYDYNNYAGRVERIEFDTKAMAFIQAEILRGGGAGDVDDVVVLDEHGKPLEEIAFTPKDIADTLGTRYRTAYKEYLSQMEVVMKQFATKGKIHIPLAAILHPLKDAFKKLGIAEGIKEAALELGVDASELEYPAADEI